MSCFVVFVACRVKGFIGFIGFRLCASSCFFVFGGFEHISGGLYDGITEDPKELTASLFRSSVSKSSPKMRRLEALPHFPKKISGFRGLGA